MENLTDVGHVLGMLDRDQRTAKPSVSLSRDRKNRISSSTSSSSYGSEYREYESVTTPGLHNVSESNLHRIKSISHTKAVRGRTSPSSSLRVRKNHNRNFWVSIPRFHRTLILGVYLSVVTLPTTLAAPSTKRPAAMTSNDLEKWMNPCGRNLDQIVALAANAVYGTDAKRLNQIIDQTNRSQRKANEFKEKFAKQTFNIDWEQLHTLHKSYPSYEWLPGADKIPKSLGQPIEARHLNTLDLDSNLYNTYESLQRIAVGFDQIVTDEQTRSSSTSLKIDFEDMEKYALSILCEIQTIMLERKLKKQPDIQRTILPDNLKNGDNTSMNVRNYIILRDYINILEYVAESFEHLKSKI